MPDADRRDYQLYHRTALEAARAILSAESRDHSGHYGTGTITRGVWLCNVPLDVNKKAKGGVLLRVHFRGQLSDLSLYEWVEEVEWKRYREWQLPAALS